MRAAFCSIPLCVLCVIGSAPAATPAPIVGLGLAKLHWGMNPQEVRAAYPALDWHQIPQSRFEFTGSYRAFGCTFTVTATFPGKPLPMLKRVILETDETVCSRDVQETLLQQFGMAEQRTSPFGVVSREWRLGLNDVEFEQDPDGWLHKPARISVIFVDLTDAIYLSQ